MRRTGKTGWFNDQKGFGFVVPSVERHRATFLTSFDEQDLVQWERSFNRACNIQ